jgi:hypothetical protein
MIYGHLRIQIYWNLDYNILHLDLCTIYLIHLLKLLQIIIKIEGLIKIQLKF